MSTMSTRTFQSNATSHCDVYPGGDAVARACGTHQRQPVGVKLAGTRA